ncbi:MAG: WecB/TagA/CpsF family glycosyltransferase [Patescibacteria group bacterium]
MRMQLLDEFKVPTLSKKEVLEQIKKYIKSPRGFFHIVSLNPENIVIALQNRTFKRVVKKARLTIIDGVGIVLAARLLQLQAGERYPGVDLMENLISHAGKGRLRVLLLGGKRNLAQSLAQCYQQSYPKAKFTGVTAIKNIAKPSYEEEKEIFRIVRLTKPHMVFAAFGSPHQELWFAKHSNRFHGAVCMGVGGAFDYLSGVIQRPHPLFRLLGIEWLMRLIRQPWRIKRQLRLLIFMYFVIKQKIHDILEIPQSA